MDKKLLHELHTGRELEVDLSFISNEVHKTVWLKERSSVVIANSKSLRYPICQVLGEYITYSYAQRLKIITVSGRESAEAILSQPQHHMEQSGDISRVNSN